MIELIDEIGRAHVKALRAVAQGEKINENATQFRHCQLVIYDRRVPKRKWDEVWSSTWRMHGIQRIGISDDVLDTLKAHGLMEVGEMSNVPVTLANKWSGTHNMYTTQFRLTARARDLLSRRMLAMFMAVFPAKANKWIVFAWAIVVLATSVVTAVEWLFR